jgi:branched-chain amino acid transport system ATP-binding protein
VLDVKGLSVGIQRTEILRDVSLRVEAGSMAGLVGRNGAGKTTVMRSVMGLAGARADRLNLDGEDLNSLRPNARAALGIGYMPEDRRLIPELSVEENICLPGWATRLPDLQTRLKLAYDILPEVKRLSARRASEISGGQQKLVALARALVPGKRLLLLDEPFEGIAPALAQRLVEVIATLRTQGAAVLLSESDYRYSEGLVDRVFVIERGAVREKGAKATGTEREPLS